VYLNLNESKAGFFPRGSAMARRMWGVCEFGGRLSKQSRMCALNSGLPPTHSHTLAQHPAK